MRFIFALLLAATTSWAAGDTAGTKQYLIKFKKQVMFAESEGRLADAGFIVRGIIPELGIFIAEPESVDKEKEALDKLKRSGTAVYVERDDKRWHTLAAPTDPLYSQQYGPRKVGAEQAWNISTGKASVVVAISDTGMEMDHVDLKNQSWTNPGEIAGNGKDDDGNGHIDDMHGWDFIKGNGDAGDENGHGTHVAGIIGAEANNGVGVAGLNWHTSLMPVRFLDATGSGSTSEGIYTILYATKMGARIINASWGSTVGSDAMRDAIDYAFQHGTLLVAAAGNEANNNDAGLSYPAIYAGVAVAAVDANSQLATFSNWGRTSVGIAAPGVNVLSTYRGNTWSGLSGTSMAAPMVSGVGALILSVDSSLSSRDLRNAILNSAVERATLPEMVATNGEVSAARALDQLAAGFQVWPSQITVQINKPFGFTAYHPNGAVTWNVSDQSIATISPSGELYGLKDGTVVITAKDSTGAIAQTREIRVVGNTPPSTGCRITPRPKTGSSPMQGAAAAVNMSLPLIVGFLVRQMGRHRGRQRNQMRRG